MIVETSASEEEVFAGMSEMTLALVCGGLAVFIFVCFMGCVCKSKKSNI